MPDPLSERVLERMATETCTPTMGKFLHYHRAKPMFMIFCVMGSTIPSRRLRNDPQKWE